MKHKLFTHLKLFSLLALCLFAVPAWAQQAISGRVNGSDGGALPGTTVLERGTTNGVSTNADGVFNLTVQPNATLVISSVGFTSQTIAVGNQTTINVTLAASATELSEAVVVGYGTQSKADLTGSVTQLTAKDVENVPVVSFEQAIQGRTPGVQINQTSGKLGSGVQIRVRGSSSVSASNQPLYVIDGIPATSEDVGSDTEPLNPLADLNPNDIESITILKDASSAAIYGSRASNGVILVNTKKGRQGQTKVNVGYYVGTSETTRRRKFLNSAQYTELFTESAENEGYDAQEEFEAVGIDTNSGIDTDWGAQAFQKGKVAQYDFNVSGGDAKTRFYLSSTFNDQTGVIVGNRYRRGSARLNLDHSITDKVKVGLNLSLTRSVNDRTPNDNAFANPLQLNALPPLQAVRDPDTGELNTNTLYYNNLLDLDRGSNRSGTYRSFSTAFLSFQPIKNLTVRTEIGADFLNLNENIYRAAGTQDGGNTGYGFSNQVQVINYTTNNTANYNFTLNEDHSFDALVGFSFQRSDANATSAEGRGFPNAEFTKVASAAIKTGGSASTRDGYSFVSQFGRINYSFRNKYLVSGSVRRDGSSRFGANNRYGNFGAGSVGWVISEESFLKENRFLNFLKLRASYGVTGNAEIGNFSSLALFGALPYADQAGLQPNAAVGNPDLTWENTTQADLGLEFGFFDNRISGEIDVYNKNTSDLLLSRPLPYVGGYTIVTENVGSLRNRGLEISLNTRNFDKEFKWSTNFNISFNRNKITELAAPIQSQYLGSVRKDQPIGVFYGRKYAGVDPANGDALYDAGVDEVTGEALTTNDPTKALQQVVGNPNPDFTGGITNSFSFKGVDLSILGQFVSGNDLYNAAGIYQSANADYFDNQTIDQLNRWRNPGDITDVPQARLGASNGTSQSSRWVTDGSFFRVKNVTLGYNLPAELAKRGYLRSARIYVSAQNLFTFTKYDGYDPEVNTAAFGAANYLVGHDFYTPPLAKTFLVGLNLGF